MDSLAYIYVVEAYDQTGHPTPSMRLNWPQVRSRAIGSAVTLALSVSLLGAAPPSAIVLKVGDSSHEVTQLQYRLAELGYLKVQATGYYGDITQEAVMHFQINNGLAPDGVVGPETKAALNQVYPNPAAPTTQPVTKLGHSGPTVFRVQRQLSSLKLYNYKKMNGQFDEETKQAVVEFQKQNGLEPDGVVGFNTHKALYEQTGL